ncbi:MAG: hypothetical protein H0W44_02555 [Gammaproteobacteria bacterium]|nr:hypothetical protein [Gammaproteobacteria bacterium]
MKKFNLVACASALMVLALSVQPAAAALKANVGGLSDYVYRGVQQSSGTGYAGIDYDIAGAYVGAWAADMPLGIETDLYAGYGFAFTENLSLKGGVLGYFYSDDAYDDAYEIGATFTAWFASIEIAKGVVDTNPDTDYTFVALTGNYKDVYAKVGAFGDDLDGNYFEIGLKKKVNDFTVGAALVNADEDLDDQAKLVFDLKYEFDVL